MVTNLNNPFIELPVIRRIIKPYLREVIIEGVKQKVEEQKFVKETRYKEKFLIYEIAKIEPHLNPITKSKSKSRCEIYYKGDNQKYVVTLSMEKVEQLINEYYQEGKTNKIGFMYKNRK